MKEFLFRKKTILLCLYCHVMFTVPVGMAPEGALHYMIGHWPLQSEDGLTAGTNSMAGTYFQPRYEK